MTRTDLVRIGRNLRVAHDVGALNTDGADEAKNAVADAFVAAQDTKLSPVANFSIAQIALKEGWNDSSLAANREARNQKFGSAWGIDDVDTDVVVNEVTAEQIIALMQRSVKALQIRKEEAVSADTDEDAMRWTRLNAKQAELQHLLGRITGYKFGIRSIEAKGD